MLSVSTQPIVAVNMGFSQTGLNALNVTESIDSAEFQLGMFSANFLFGDSSSDWIAPFAGTAIHGVFLLVSDTEANIDAQVTALETTLGSSIVKQYSLLGSSRPGSEAGHESKSSSRILCDTPSIYASRACSVWVSRQHRSTCDRRLRNPGEQAVPPGIILFGLNGDQLASSRPAWTTGGSLLAFRQLAQKVHRGSASSSKV